MQLADRCRLDADRLRERLDHLRAHPPAEPTRAGAAGPAATSRRPGVPERRRRRRTTRTTATQRPLSAALRPGPGLEALKLAVHRPEDVADRVHAVLFTDPVATRRRSSRSWSTTACTRRWSPRHRRWRACCDASSSRSPWRVTPNWAIRSTPSSSCSCAARRGARWPRSRCESRAADDSWQARAAETAQVRLWLDQLGRSDGRTRRRRPVGSVVGRRGTRSDDVGRARVSDDSAIAIDDEGDARRRVVRRRSEPLASIAHVALPPGVSQVDFEAVLAIGREKGQLTQAELIEALHTVELTPEVLTIADRPRHGRGRRARRRRGRGPRGRGRAAQGQPVRRNGPNGDARKPEPRRDTNGKRAELAASPGGSAEDPVHTYLKEIGRVPLLNAELEVEIAQAHRGGERRRGQAGGPRAGRGGRGARGRPARRRASCRGTGA